MKLYGKIITKLLYKKIYDDEIIKRQHKTTPILSLFINTTYLLQIKTIHLSLIFDDYKINKLASKHSLRIIKEVHF